MAGIRRINKDLPQFVVKTPTGAYKYQRRVPPDLQSFLFRKVWDYSLGSEPTAAYRRAHALTDQHSDIIERFKSVAARKEQEEFRITVVQAMSHATEDPEPDEWRETPNVLKEARALSPRSERNRLVVWAAQAFGDHRAMDQEPVEGWTAVLKLEPNGVVRPTDPTDALMFDAFLAALNARIQQISPAATSEASMTLTALMQRYTAKKRPATARAYMQKAKRLSDAYGDHPLPSYSFEQLRSHRDNLLEEGVSPPSVIQHFNNLQTLWTWAAREYRDTLTGLTFPRPDDPDNTTTIEETRWQAFDEHQIKHVWELLKNAWGPEAKSRLSPTRRAALLMAVRVLLYTGLRPSEVFRIGPEDVQNGVIHVRHTKTRTQRKIPLAAALADFPGFLANGGFTGELEVAKPESLAGTLSDNFRVIIRAGGLTNDRHVLYSLKDTLIDRLQRQGATDDTMRGIIGHVSGQGKLRHYKTPFGQSKHGMEAMRKALDAIAYW